jgi:uncharacterized membrane-anchored protein YjiN (DUF445 family)
MARSEAARKHRREKRRKRAEKRRKQYERKRVKWMLKLTIDPELDNRLDYAIAKDRP